VSLSEQAEGVFRDGCTRRQRTWSERRAPIDQLPRGQASQ
jgi:hypothetical protein